MSRVTAAPILPATVPRRYADDVSADPVPAAADLWRPDPLRQAQASYTVEDIVNLPDGAPRVELLDGVVIVVPSPSRDHQNLAGLLFAWMYRHTPPGLVASQMVGVAVGLRDSYEPDVVVMKAESSGENHLFPADQVVLVVEVVSPGTRHRDRFLKPGGYAAAGIRHYWRVEQNPVHVFAYELGDDGHYALAADSADLLELDRPFPIKLPVAEIAP